MENSEEAVYSDLLACLALSDSCPFISSSDPRLVYFGAGLLSLYVLFFSVLLVDVLFWRNIDELEKNIYEYINSMRKKMELVRSDRQQFKSLQTRAEEEMNINQDSLETLCCLRSIARDMDAKNFNRILSAIPADDLKLDNELFANWEALDDMSIW